MVDVIELHHARWVGDQLIIARRRLGPGLGSSGSSSGSGEGGTSGSGPAGSSSSSGLWGSSKPVGGVSGLYGSSSPCRLARFDRIRAPRPLFSRACSIHWRSGCRKRPQRCSCASGAVTTPGTRAPPPQLGGIPAYVGCGNCAGLRACRTGGDGWEGALCRPPLRHVTLRGNRRG